LRILGIKNTTSSSSKIPPKLAFFMRVYHNVRVRLYEFYLNVLDQWSELVLGSWWNG